MNRRTLLAATASLPLLGLPSKAIDRTLRDKSVVVVGSGAFGSWTALKLMEQGAQVTIVDPWGPGNARSSSGGESRVIRSVYGTDEIYTQWVRRSFKLWKDVETKTKKKLYQPTGLLWMFSEPDDYMRSSIPFAEKQGFKIDEWKVERGQKKFPQVNFAGINTLFYEHSAGYLLARRSCAAVTQYAKQLGAKSVLAAAQPLENLKGGLKEIHLADGQSIKADQFVFACGPWLPQVFPDVLGDKIEATRQEIHYFGYPAKRSTKKTQLPIWVDFGKRLFYGVPDSEHRGFKIADDTRGEKIDPTTMNRVPTQSSIDRCQEFMSKRFPHLAKAPLLESRVCQYENSLDGNFIIDQHPTAENVWIVGGGSGHGFKLSPAIGEFVANRVAGNVKHEHFFELKRLDQIKKKKTQFDQAEKKK